MSTAAAIQCAAYNMRLRRRGRQFASALTVHQSGLTVIGANQFDGRTDLADFVQDSVGNAWVALTSGTSGATPLTGNSTMSDGGIVWQPWIGIIRSARQTPTP